MQKFLDAEFFQDLCFFHEEYIHSTQYQTQSIKIDDTKEIFKQAVYCFLTPATKSDSADYTHQKLFTDDFFYSATLQELADCLREKPYIRFHNQKAERLLLWQQNGDTHVKEMLKFTDAFSKRDYIIKNVKGMNFKEATHFLRNVGMSEDLVILDRHIIRFMQDVQILDDDIKNLSKNYLKWEQMFVEFVRGDMWRECFGESTIPQADFAIWASFVKKADPNIDRQRILLLR